ncbi:hypothetical protein [Azospirillum canadense]|uniref:hypothetical protein n=1 Tax=Azospirillum canadense TaxID=403962 RepID=UPI00222679A4|nr:hypothetical protein [Azospirillum canadense]MCW2243749.1 hypothetical protein [Azospirillum canadense]
MGSAVVPQADKAREAKTKNPAARKRLISCLQSSVSRKSDAKPTLETNRNRIKPPKNHQRQRIGRDEMPNQAMKHPDKSSNLTTILIKQFETTLSPRRVSHGPSIPGQGPQIALAVLVDAVEDHVRTAGAGAFPEPRRRTQWQACLFARAC